MNFHLTTAGLAAIVNPANTGVNALVIDRIGVSAVALPGDPEDHAGLVALPNELKRLATFAGLNVGDNVIHVTIRDESADVYSLRTFGLYSSTGVLLAYVTSAAPISEKTASSMTLIAADLAFTATIAAEVSFGDTDFINPPATTATAGVVELATREETEEGTDPGRAVTPYGLKWMLDRLLQGFAALVHTHDASAITSGVLQVARIPALEMSKITGLAAALFGKADSVHTHSADDVNSGVLAVGRIPALDMSKITGLAAALADRLLAANFTWANLGGKPAVVISETDAVLRSLQLKLANPANASIYLGDQQVGARRFDFNGDVFKFIGAPLQVLGYNVWTAQTFNPADKANALHSHDWSQVTGRPDLVINYRASITARGAEGNGYAVLAGGDADHSGALELWTPAGNRVFALQADLNAETISVVADNGFGLDFDQRPTFMGLQVWDAGNFTPASKANVVHTHAMADITGLTSALAGKAATAHGHTTTDITDLLDKFWPAGELKLFDMSAPPAGVRVMQAVGANLSRTTYARLFAAWGTRYGAGDGATTFGTPDWRGVFFRGLDSGRGLDTGRMLGSLQMSQNLAHAHTYTQLIGVDNTQPGSGVQGGAAGYSELTSSSGGTEARPTNHALLACFTY